MSEWIKCSDRMPEHSDEVMVCRKWPGQDCFAPEFDRWVSDEGWMKAVSGCWLRTLASASKPVPMDRAM